MLKQMYKAHLLRAKYIFYKFFKSFHPFKDYIEYNIVKDHIVFDRTKYIVLIFMYIEKYVT